MTLVRATGNGATTVMAEIEQKKRAFQRKDVGQAYRKNAEYYQPKKNPTLAELEDLLLGNKEKENVSKEVNAAIKEYQLIEKNKSMLDIKGPTLPVQTIGGPTPEKTIELLEKVRSSALTSDKPSPQELRLAANATAKIQTVQSQITLNQEATRQIDLEAKRQKEDEAAVSNRSVQSEFQSPKVLGENLQKKRFIEQAIAKYSFQVHMKKYGFTDQQPSFFRIA
ncbi:hypothetical protein KD050_14015 [Psychrobacillus sp. INOP01]|uniref:hypothetical protein n=1 Tax=Psychrobacillus sp. INOP01 TaxID=2829187 RepID=UPI001BA587F9|nr:hypothetical protein [Psychrobacillus sp. INOP01]QUG40402.1 hypothetical protein KD050_14015 [Psychrobacillus sp. INOP01]